MDDRVQIWQMEELEKVNTMISFVDEWELYDDDVLTISKTGDMLKIAFESNDEITTDFIVVTW